MPTTIISYINPLDLSGEISSDDGDTSICSDLSWDLENQLEKLVMFPHYADCGLSFCDKHGEKARQKLEEKKNMIIPVWLFAEEELVYTGGEVFEM